MPRVATPSDGRLRPERPPTPIISVLRNSAANLGRIGAAWAVALLLPPVLVRVLDKPTYGTWMLVLQIGAYVAFLDGGIQNAIARFIGRAEGLKDREYMSRMLSSAWIVLVVVGGITLCATLVLYWQLDRWFPQIPAAIADPARQALLAIGVSLAIGLPFSAYAGAFFGLQMNHVNAVAASLGKLTGAAGAAWAAFHHQGLLIMSLWVAAGNLVQAAIFMMEWNRRPNLRHVGLTNMNWRSVREFLHFCSAMFATQFGALLITGLDLPVVAKFDFHATAYYAVAAMAGNLIAVPQGAIVSTLIPIASEISATGSPEQLGRVVLKTSRYANCVLCLMILPLLFGMHLFLRVWVGAEYASHALTLALILAGAQFVRLTLTPYASVGFAAGQQHRMLISPLVEGLVNLACSVAGAYLWGAIGVAVGTLIGAFAGVLIHFTNSMPRTSAMAFSRNELLLRGITLPAACCAPAVLMLLLALRHCGSAGCEVGLIALGEGMAVLVCLRFAVNRNERHELGSTLAHMARDLGKDPAISGTI